MALTYVEAYKAYGKNAPQDAVRALEKTIGHYVSKGQERRAAQHGQNLAETYEVQLGDQDRALKWYRQTAEWYESDGADALANKYFLKAAELAALVGGELGYAEASQNFEKVAKSSLDHNLMKWSVKDYFLKAGICYLAAGDQVQTRKKLDEFKDLDNSFGQTREYMLLTDLAQCVEDGDQDAFSDKLFQFDSLSKLDKWKTTLLLRVKNSIEQAEEDFS